MIIVDTGVLYALTDRRDTHHKACVRWLAAAPRPLIVRPLVIAEHRLNCAGCRQPGTREGFLDGRA
ncbi:MAG TPA: PIN domain-containing protein [Pseudonocardiaceae bacterium]|nr:PIN domain-containing protein [Pseudonocardiaceae bacterium]